MTRTMNTLRGTATPKLLLLTLGFLLLAVVIGCGSSSSEEAASPQAPMAAAPAAPAAPAAQMPTLAPQALQQPEAPRPASAAPEAEAAPSMTRQAPAAVPAPTAAAGNDVRLHGNGGCSRSLPSPGRHRCASAGVRSSSRTCIRRSQLCAPDAPRVATH